MGGLLEKHLFEENLKFRICCGVIKEIEKVCNNCIVTEKLNTNPSIQVTARAIMADEILSIIKGSNYEQKI